MILSNLTKFKIKYRPRINKFIREWNGIQININRKLGKVKIQCDSCNKIFDSLLQNQFDTKKHLCFTCRHTKELNGKYISFTENQKEEIISLYMYDEYSTIQIAKLFYCSHSKIYRFLKSKGLNRKAGYGTKRSIKLMKKKNKGRKFSEESKIKMRNSARKRYISNKLLNVNYSKISQKLFWKIYKQIKNDFKEIYFATLNQKTKKVDWSGRNWEYKVITKKHTRFLDFYIKDVNLAIEYYNNFWHKNRDDVGRVKEIKEVIPDIKISFVKDPSYSEKKNNKLNELYLRCLDFIND